MQALWNSVLLCSRRGGHHDQIHHGTPRQTRHGRWLGPHGYLDSETHPGHDPDPDSEYERDPEHDVP